MDKTKNKEKKAEYESSYHFHNTATYQIMYELFDSRYNMMNPIITKWLQIQTIFYSKSFAQLGPVASIDPNQLLTYKQINQHRLPDEHAQARPAGSFVSQDSDPKKDNLLQKMENIAYAQPDRSKFDTVEMER